MMFHIVKSFVSGNKTMIVKLTKIRSRIKASNAVEVKKALADLLAKMT